MLGWGGFSLVWFSLGFDVGLVQDHKRWSTLIQRIPFRSSSQVNVDTVQIPFSHHVDGPEQRPVEHEAKPNQRKPAPDLLFARGQVSSGVKRVMIVEGPRWLVLLYFNLKLWRKRSLYSSRRHAMWRFALQIIFYSILY